MADCWVITDGNAGAKSQAIGLAEALGLNFEEKIFRLKSFFRIFAPYLIFDYTKFSTATSSKFSKPYPKIVIVCGSSARSIGPYLKKIDPNIFTIFLQDPKINPKYYDLIIAPYHDKIKGENVIKINFALNRVTKDKLLSEQKKFDFLAKKFESPYNVILIGGNTKKYKMSDAACDKIIEDIDYILENNKGSFLITNSRRTPDKVNKELQKKFNGSKKVYFYDFNSQGNNPFFAFLSLAQKIFITNDSISMLAEASNTNKSIKVLPLLNHDSTKVAKVFEQLKERRKITLFNDNHDPEQNNSGKSETAMVADKIRKILEQKGISLKINI